MGYPIAPAWLLGSRQLNQSQIELWTASSEYIFLILHTGKHKHSWMCGCLLRLWLQQRHNIEARLRSTDFFFFSFSGWFTYITLFSLNLFSLAIFLHSFTLFLFLPLFSSQASGHRLSFKVLLLIWNLLQSAQHWTWNTGLWDPIRFQSKIINERPGRAIVKHVWDPCVVVFIEDATLSFLVM